jgi:hypothetical protein
VDLEFSYAPCRVFMKLVLLVFYVTPSMKIKLLLYNSNRVVSLFYDS